MFSRRMNFVRFAAVCLIGLAVAAVGQEKPANPTADVEVCVRDPKGRPLERAAIEVLPFKGDHPLDKRAGVNATTDDLGMARFVWPVGVDHVRILAKGIGYGTTGTFEVVEGKTAHPAVAPLVAYGAVVGTVPKALLRPGIYVRRRDVETDKEYRATCDEKGRFVMEDVPCGRQWLEVRVDDKPLGVRATVRVEPGQRIRALFYQNQDKLIVPAQPESPVPPRKKEEQAVWAAGVVRDEKGRAVKGATVYAIASYHGGIRMYETIQSAKSDDKGRWEIKGQGDLSMFSGSLLAYKPGRSPAVLPLPVPGWTPRASDEEAKRNCEFILPDHGGGLEVTVLSGDEPLANASVQLTGDATELYGGWARPAHGPERDQIQALLHPTATTDAKGVAKFQDITPGVYSVLASTGGDHDARATCHGVAVRVGETKKCQIVAYPRANLVRLQVLQPNGKPITLRAPGFDWAKVVGASGQSSSATLDENGAGANAYEAPGLWHVSFRYRDSPSKWFPIRETPYYEASGVVAVSPLLDKQPTTPLTAQFHEPGALIVQLQDVNGRPARGAVFIDGQYDQPAFAGSTDGRGVVRFDGVQAWKHEVEAHITGLDPPDLGIDDAPFPTDKELVGRTAVFIQEVATVNDDETRVTIRPTRVGYIRGVVHPSRGRTAADYTVARLSPDKSLHMDSRYSNKTGEFLFGPLVEEKATVQILCGNWFLSLPFRDAQEVEVRNDRVAHIEFTPTAEVKPQKPAEGIHGQVLLSDGKTPAGAARLAVFYPDLWQAREWGETDARGRINMRETRGGSNDKPTDRPGSPEQPVVVAWLPGACGATITPLADGAQPPLNIVLPPPLRIQGKVTVGGKAVQGRKNQLRVLASYEGKGKIDDLLSLDVNAEADGRFELAGLTPGTYQVQAAMDNIWLSRTVSLAVKPEAASFEPLTLDVGEPGAPSVMELAHPDGTPVRGGTVKIVRPKGPLTDLLWPIEFTADGAGRIEIPPLEVGSHTVRVTGAAEEQTLTIPSLHDERAKAVKVRVVVK